MNKKLLPLAISAALAAGVAAPGAANADVTIYGKLHMSLDYFKSSVDNGPNINDLQVSSNSSRIGFKGSEDLGGGLKAFWQLEQGVNITDNNGNAWVTRNSFLGLGGGFGSVLAGKHDTPMKIVGRSFDAFGDTIFDTRAIMGSTSTGANAFNLRTSNTVAYITPPLGGFQFIGAYVADYTDNSSAPSNNDNDAFSALVAYDIAGFKIMAAYEKHRAGSGPEPSMVRAGASYKIAGFEVGGLAEKGKGDGLESIDRWAGNVYGKYSFGSNTVKAQFTKAWEAVHNDDSYMWSVGLDHAFSKRTKVYGAVGMLNQKREGDYYMGGGHNTNTFNTREAGENQKAVTFGMIHTF